MGLSLIPSSDKFYSFQAWACWIALFLVFVATSAFTDSATRLRKITWTVVASATAASLLGLYGLYINGNIGYLHVESLFNEHNAFGGFLLIPLCILLLGILEEKNGIEKWLWLAASSIVGAAFILTFSRGSWLSLITAFALTMVIFRSKIFLKLRNKKILMSIGIAALGIILISFGMYEAIALKAASENSTVSIYAGETLESNTITARLHYFQDALTVIAKKPILGVGVKHYGEAVKLYKDTPAFYASSPHNELLRQTAETGIIGGALFALFMLLTLYGAYRTVSHAQTELSIVSVSIFTGLLAVAFHICIEVDWGYVANPLLFVVFAGVLSGKLFSGFDFQSVTSRTRFTLALFPLTGLALALWGLGYWYESYSLDLASIAATERNYDEAIIDVQKAKFISNLDPASHYIAATLYEHIAHTTPLPILQQDRLQKSLDEIRFAIALKPQKPLFYSWEALIANDMGSTTLRQKALENTVRFNPVEGVEEYSELAYLYNAQKEYDKTIALANKVLPYYPPELYANLYWINPDKPGVWRIISNIYTQLGVAEKNKKNKTEAKDAFAKALQYNQNNPEAKEELSKI
jgi:O-antigen ligase